MGDNLKILKVSLIVIFIWTFIGGFIFSYTLFTGGPDPLGILIGFANAILSPHLIILYPIITVFFSKLIPKIKHKIIYSLIIIIGLSLSIIFAIPLLMVPISIQQTNSQFYSNYGPNWNSFPAQVQNNFYATPFELYLLYYGIPDSNEHKFGVYKDIIFVNETDYQLYFDVYYPKESGFVNNATIIYIHGGAWTGGEKEQQASTLEYFASQGYIVFAIEYRLLNASLLEENSDSEIISELFNLPTTGLEYRTGNYTLADQITDIGTFTKFIANNSNNIYGANLNRVFFMGGSAGAHLAGVCGFGYKNEYFTGIFSRDLQINGVVLYYPPNNASEFFYYVHRMYYEINQFIPGTPETNPEAYLHYSPSYLINENSPPCILLHGTSDTMVPYKESITIQLKMQENNRKCILVPGYFGGHGHILGIQHNIMTTYYIERFLYHNTLDN